MNTTRRTTRLTPRMLYVQALLLFFINGLPLAAMPVGLRLDRRVNPLGLENPQPTFSWRSDDTARNWVQSAYQVQVASDPALLAGNKPDIWDSGRVASNESIGLPYKGPALLSGKRYVWRVRTWDSSSRQQLSQEPAWWEMGLLGTDAWKAHWISFQDQTERRTLQQVRWLWLPGGHVTTAINRDSFAFTLKALKSSGQLSPNVSQLKTPGS